jgi:hypothetical protein
MSHVLGGGLGSILGDVVGGVGGFLLGGPLGAAVGAGLGGAAGSAASGGSLTQDLLGGVEGAALGFGGGELASGLGAGAGLLGGASDAGSAAAGGAELASGAADTGAAAASGVTDAASGVVGTASDAATGLGLGSSAAPAGVSANAVSGLGSVAAASPTDLTSALGAVPSGSELSAADQSLLGAQGSLASGGTNAVGLSTSSDLASGAASGLGIPNGTGPTLGGFTAGDAAASGQIPLPPVPPALDAAGNPVVTAAGQGVYPSAADAQAAANYSASGGVASAQPDSSGAGGFLGSVGSALGAHPLQALSVGVAGLGFLKDITSQNSIPGMSQLTSLAQNSAAQGQVLQNYLTTGTLPPAIQASVQAATQDGITAIKAKYASMGIAPNSQAEIQDVARLQQNAVVQGATLADQLLQQGISETQLSGTLYKELVQSNTTLNNQTNSAITSLASALAGGGVRLGGGTNNTNPSITVNG